MSAVALNPRRWIPWAEAAEDYILTNCPPDSSILETSETPEMSEIPEAPETVEQGDGTDVKHILDTSNLLSHEEWEELESRGRGHFQPPALRHLFCHGG